MPLEIPKTKPSAASSIQLFSAMLRHVTILNADFETAVKTARRGDFIYFDPPYHPLSKTAKFTAYNRTGFPLTDQVRLAGVFTRLSKKGVLVMLSNSKVQEIEHLYEGNTIETVAATRCINCKGNERSGSSEIIVTNYDFNKTALQRNFFRFSSFVYDRIRSFHGRYRSIDPYAASFPVSRTDTAPCPPQTRHRFPFFF